jgi:hypothetical protein
LDCTGWRGGTRWNGTRTNIAAMVITDDHDVYVTRHFDRYRAA